MIRERASVFSLTPLYCQKRDRSQARQIRITGIVKGTKGESRATGEAILKKKSLVFADPRDRALAAAIHACKNNGEDLFEDLWITGSVPGVALCTNPDRGVRVLRCNETYGDRNVAASGSPSLESK